VLLPGVTTIARLVARVRDEATERQYDTLYQLLTPGQRAILEMLLEVPAGSRISDLERWRKGPSVPSGRSLEKALRRTQEILAVGLGQLELPPGVPHRRMVDLARHGMAAKAPALRRHRPPRQLATLLATVVYLEAMSPTREGAAASEAGHCVGEARGRGGGVVRGQYLRRGARPGAGVGVDRGDRVPAGAAGGVRNPV
jgi:hypothetical protein